MLTDEELEQLIKMYLSSKGYNMGALSSLGDKSSLGNNPFDSYNNLAIEDKIKDYKNSNLRVLGSNEKPIIENPSDKVRYVILPSLDNNLLNGLTKNYDGNLVGNNYGLTGLIDSNVPYNNGVNFPYNGSSLVQGLYDVNSPISGNYGKDAKLYDGKGLALQNAYGNKGNMPSVYIGNVYINVKPGTSNYRGNYSGNVKRGNYNTKGSASKR